jgi:hypothetical protein
MTIPKLLRTILLAGSLAASSIHSTAAEPSASSWPGPITDKTLVAWVCLSNLTQQGGSALTLQAPNQEFDAIVVGELAPGKWMAGSDFWRRTSRHQAHYPAENAGPDTLVQVAVVYHGHEITICRNGQEYARHALAQPQVFGPDSKPHGHARQHFRSPGGVVLEGTLKLPASKEAKPVGLFLAQRDDSGTAILVRAGGVTEFGPMRADGTGFKSEQRVDREWKFGAEARFRLLLKGSPIEFYLDALLMQCFSLPQVATGKFGLIQGGQGKAIGNLM